MVGGGLLQLVGIGPQDLYLSGHGNINFDHIFTDKDLLKEIMDYKGGINDIVYPEDYRTFFNKAVYYGFKDSLIYLLERGVENFIKCKYFDDPFNFSINNCRLEIANILFKHGIINERKLDGINFLDGKISHCYDKGYLELTNYLIKNCNQCFIHGSYYDYNLLVYFIEHGAYINSGYRNALEKDVGYILGNFNTKTDEYNDFYDYYDSDDSDSEDPFYKYIDITIDKNVQKNFQYIAQKLAKRRWIFVKCYTRLLGLHQRAVITANHPNRLKKLGYFNVIE